jgi:hypothetical protein
MSEAGSVIWPGPNEPLWTFGWRLADAPDEEGIVVRSARFRGHQMFYKASLPSLRVQYDGPCGPYKDPLNYNNAQPTSRCPNSRVCLYTYTPDVGWGQGWHAKTYEITRLKDASSNRRWAVMDRSSQRGYLLVPGAGDGAADAFSSADLWVLRYQPTEDRNGLQGNAAGDGLGAYLNHEDVGGQDVVVWYCGHLSHHAHDGGDHWHAVGPDLIPFGSW